ncbi:MAG: spermidine/putrescine ABC transporter substrate-binding protein [Simkaniaceae bacterium]|nr:spermidine/putrescine ABC transporter substrate-binding protein [Simkaniaceae bacterium]MCF7852348.1 spermidine/putrescine ABC transporter substrate-binding protein [Simkaniaceae bacterium]
MKKQRNSFSLIRLIFIGIWVVLLFALLNLANIAKKDHPRTIDVFAWGDFFDHDDILKKFEERTGIKVNIHPFASNEEMYTKLLSNKNGYDLIIPSDYMVKTLIQKNLLKPLDHQRLQCLNAISPSLLHLEYDPNNIYSLPCAWEIYGIVIDQEIFPKNKIPHSLHALFDPEVVQYKLIMPADAGEAILFASHYLYGPLSQLTKEQADQVLKLLISQKKWVEAYVDYRGKYLIQTKNCHAGILRSSFAFSMFREHPFLHFITPDEATFISIENLAIPAHSKKEDLVYQFINYLYEPKVQAQAIGKHSPMYPANPSALDYIDESQPYFDQYYRSLERQDFVFFKRLLSEEEMRKIWIEVKSH